MMIFRGWGAEGPREPWYRPPKAIAVRRQWEPKLSSVGARSRDDRRLASRPDLLRAV